MMKMIARKYFLPIILGSVIIFAIDTATVNATKISPTEYNITTTNTIDSIVHLEDNEFWDKFRESVMKDKDKNKNNPDNPNGDDRNDPPRNDIQSARH